MARKARTAEVDLDRLCNAIRASREVLEPHRVARRKATEKYAGDQWTQETAKVERPINFLSLYLQIMYRNLVSSHPKVSLSTFQKKYAATVSTLEDWANPEIKRMKLVRSLQRGVIDAIYGFHVMKVGLCTPAESEKSGWEMTVGQPYARCIDLDDWAWDIHARTIDELSWMGHRTRVTVDSLKESVLYDAVRRRSVEANPDKQFNEPGDEKISMLGRGYLASNVESEAYEYCDIWEIYLPMEKLILTFLSEDGGTPQLTDARGKSVAFDERSWIGPYCGPYHFLNLMPPVSGNLMSKGPIQDLIGMDEALNGLTQKLMNQAIRQKEILAFASNSDSDADRIGKSRDGEIVRVDNPDKLKQMGFGGPHPNNQNFTLSLWEMLNKLGGNVELLGGLGEQSKTATQDKMLNANAGASMKSMQQAVVEHTSNVVESLCWFWHHHPEKVMTGYREIPGLDRPIERTITPEDRQQVPYEAMEVIVDPYSLNHMAPGEKLAFINQVMQQTLIPLLPLLEKQGIGVNMGKYLEIVGEFGNVPELGEIITNLAESQGMEEGGEEEGAGKPASTSRTYVRNNASTATGEGQVKANLQHAMGRPMGGRPSTNGSYKPTGG